MRSSAVLQQLVVEQRIATAVEQPVELLTIEPFA
jgi:hypothetical protein